MDQFQLANAMGGKPEDYANAELVSREFTGDMNNDELAMICEKMRNDPDLSIGDRVLNGDRTVPAHIVCLVFKEWMKRGETDKIITAFGRAGRCELDNEQLAQRAKEKGLDEYEVIERAAIMEYDGGMPQWMAEAYALGESINVEGF